MITKGFVEELVGKTSVRVRVPMLDKADYANSGAHFDDLSIATVCALPSCSPNLQVGDVVFVGFEDNSRHKPVILGYLYSNQSSYYDIKLKSLDVEISAILSKDTTIGSVLPNDLDNLTDLQENIQDSLDSAQIKIDDLATKVRENRKSLTKKSAKLFDNSLKIDGNSSSAQLLAEQIGSVSDTDKPTLFGKIRSISSKLSNIKNKIGSNDADQSIMAIINNIKARIETLEESCKLVYIEDTNDDNVYHDSVNSDSNETEVPTVTGEMRTSQEAIDFIKSKEGFAEYAAWDYAQYSIGYGCHCGKNEYPNGITREQAHQLLIKELKTEFEPEIAKLESNRSKKFTQNEWDAIVSFSFNVGTAWCSNYSYNIYKYVMLKQPYTDQEFKDCMRSWSHAGGEQLEGLVVRREEEADMYTKGIYP